MEKSEKQKYFIVQNIAKETMIFLKNEVTSGMTEIDIRSIAEDKLLELGADSFWYYNVGALVLIGERTIISKSGKNYKATTMKIKKNDIVTVDLSPALGGYWGDYARTIIVGDRKIFQKGFDFENYLHQYFRKVISPEISMGELFDSVNRVIDENGYQNLDFNKNLGHTIEKKKEARKYFESGNAIKIKEIQYFTFEPHIRYKNDKYGYKMENIYYFADGRLKEL